MQVTEGTPVLPGYCLELQFISLDYKHGGDTRLGWGRAVNWWAECTTGEDGGKNKDIGANIV